MEAARVPVIPEGELFRADIAGVEFAAGADRGYWRLVEIAWPFAIIAVTAAPRPGSPDEYLFRFDLTGYPAAPTAQPWDGGVGVPLAPHRWPGGTGRVASAFNPSWRQDAIYLPVDRVALDGHDAWRTEHAAYLWDQARDITQYLRILRDLLTSAGYTGVRG